MRKSVEGKLLSWKNSDRRKPLVLLGMRRCGKTFILTEFGKNHFEDYVCFDFECNPRLADVFHDLDPKRILKELSSFRGRMITKDTLIIFDGIQHCYPALTSLNIRRGTARPPCGLRGITPRTDIGWTRKKGQTRVEDFVSRRKGRFHQDVADGFR